MSAKAITLPDGTKMSVSNATRYVLAAVWQDPRQAHHVTTGVWKWNDDESVLHAWVRRWVWRKNVTFYVVDTKTGKVRP